MRGRGSRSPRLWRHPARSRQPRSPTGHRRPPTAVLRRRRIPARAGAPCALDASSRVPLRGDRRSRLGPRRQTPLREGHSHCRPKLTFTPANRASARCASGRGRSRPQQRREAELTVVPRPKMGNANRAFLRRPASGAERREERRRRRRRRRKPRHTARPPGRNRPLAALGSPARHSAPALVPRRARASRAPRASRATRPPARRKPAKRRVKPGHRRALERRDDQELRVQPEVRIVTHGRHDHVDEPGPEPHTATANDGSSTPGTSPRGRAARTPSRRRARSPTALLAPPSMK